MLEEIRGETLDTAQQGGEGVQAMEENIKAGREAGMSSVWEMGEGLRGSQAGKR